MVPFNTYERTVHYESRIRFKEQEDIDNHD